MIQEIFPFCQVRDDHNNLTELSNRGVFIQNLLERYNIEYELIPYDIGKEKIFYNFYIWGSSDMFLTAHYDVVNTASDNANDNSASIINALVYKIKNPSINVVILDGEEPPWMGDGSRAASKEFRERRTNVKGILNLELTGFGRDWFIDNSYAPIVNHIKKTFPDKDVLSIPTPFNDATIFRQHIYNACVITTLPDLENEAPYPQNLNFEILYYSHTKKDSVSNINIDDMNHFIDNIIDPIIKNY